MLTVREAAAVLRISKSKAYELVAAGKLPHIRFGKVVRIPEDRLLGWIQTHVEEPGEGAQ